MLSYRTATYNNSSDIQHWEKRGRINSTANQTKRPRNLVDEKKSAEYLNNSSTESLSIGRPRSVQINERKEVKFIVPNKNHNFKDDRILMVSNKVPFFIFSSIPSYKKGPKNPRFGRQFKCLYFYFQ